MNTRDSHKTLALSCTFKMVNGILQAEVDAPAQRATQHYEPGTVIDSKFRIISLLGEGGMGVVYRAHHLTLANDIALKTFRFPDLSGETWQRFQREAQAIAKLDSKHIVRVFDFGVAHGSQPYYTLELLEGESLADRINREGAVPLPETLMIFTAVAEGLVSAHAKGIVHRDLKPANIFLVQKDNKVVSVKLVDFGIAKLMGVGDDDDGQRLTAVGKIFGSPLYMSPEQSIGEDTDQRSDIYSYACALYEALTGRPPFLGENAFATICSHQNDKPPSLAKGHAGKTYPAWLESLISLMLAKKKEERVQSFHEVLDVFSSYKISDFPKSAHIKSDTTYSGEIPKQQLDVNEDRRPGGSGSKNLLRMVIVALSLFTLVLAAGYSFRDRLWPNIAKTNPGQPAVRPVTPAAAVEGSHITKAGPQKRFFQRIESSPTGPMRVFRFPEKSVGQFYIGDEYFDKRPKNPKYLLDCINIVRIPQDDKWTFEPGARMAAEPSLFDGFQGDDLANLAFGGLFESNDEWHDVHVHAIAHLSGLKRLSIKTSAVDGHAIPDIGKLKGLVELQLSESKINGKDLLKLTNLYGLDTLDANRLEKMPEFLKGVDHGRLKVRMLQIKADNTKDSDLLEVAKIKSIENLNVDDNRVSDAGIEYLTKLPRLKNLCASNTNVGPGVIDILGQIKTLSLVFLSSSRFSQADKARLKQLLPHCNVQLKSASSSVTE